MKKLLKNNYHILTYILLYSSIIIAFYYDKNVTGGAKLVISYLLFFSHYVISFINTYYINF